MNRFQPLRMLFAANTLLITFYLVVTTINTLTKPPFSLDRYPYTLSDEAQQSVSQCLVIVDSLDKPITYQAG